MANTLALRRRIKSAQNISKTTKAMQMIAASKLKRAQLAALSSRPYVEKLVSLTRNVAPRKILPGDETSHPYMRSHTKTGKTLYVIIGPDKGLCGGMITNLIREYLKVRSDDRSLFVTVGKKIEAPVASAKKNLVASFPFGSVLPTYDMVYPLIEIIDDHFLGNKVDKVKILTTHFNTVFSQTPKVSDLLPVIFSGDNSESFLKAPARRETDPAQVGVTGGNNFRLFEPNPEYLLPTLLKKYIEMQLYQHLLESFASFQAAQMIAMQNATDNAKDIVNALRLLYNKARQEKITNEILDISSASVALSNQN